MPVEAFEIATGVGKERTWLPALYLHHGRVVEELELESAQPVRGVAAIGDGVAVIVVGDLPVVVEVAHLEEDRELATGCVYQGSRRRQAHSGRRLLRGAED